MHISLLTGFIPQCGLIFHDRKFHISFYFFMLNMNNVQASNATEGKVGGAPSGSWAILTVFCLLLRHFQFTVK